MKVGDLVKMAAEGKIGLHHGDEWGIGIILKIDERQSRTFGGTDVEVLWSKLGGPPSWEMPEMLEIVNESG